MFMQRKSASRRALSAVAFCGVSGAVAIPAATFAQTSTVAANKQAADSVSIAAITTADAAPSAESASTPPVSASFSTEQPSVFSKAAEHGLYFKALATLEFAANPWGGLRQGATSTQYLAAGMDADLNKLVGWRGGYVHIAAIALNGSSLSSAYTGGGIAAQEANAPFSVVRFFELTLEQRLSLLHPDDVSLIAGRMGAFPAFARSDYACLLQSNFFCGGMYGFSQSTGTALTPVSTWGGRARYNFTPKTYFQFGGFAIDSSELLSSTHMFSFGSQGITGTNWLAEGGYETNYGNDPMPRSYRLGLWYNSAPRNDALLNTAGLPYYRYGGVRLTHTGETGLYGIAEQVVYRENAFSKRGVALFASGMYNIQDSEPIKYVFKAGVVKQGTFSGRDNDTLTFAAGIMSFTDGAVQTFNGYQERAGGIGNVAKNEGILELNYGYQVTPGVVLRPNIQYYINPDPRNAPTSPRKIPNIFVVGVSLNVSLDTLMHLPRM